MMAGNKQKVHLKAGMLDLIYLDGTLRYVKSGRIEIVRMIYPALRDREWLNIEGIRSNEKMKVSADSFNITYNIRYTRDEIALEAKIEITGSPDSSILYRFEAEALNTFMTNRAGLCILHPVEGCAGKPCKIVHSDGTAEELAFPYHISPQQPFTDIGSMIWYSGTYNCRIDFSGDIFETEDQRNWTDDSFKTYSRPLSLPFPVCMEKGVRIVQELRLSVNGKTEEISVPDTININIGRKEPVAFPSVGICRTSGSGRLTDQEADALKEAGFDHYRTELDLTKPGWVQTIADAVAEAESLALPMELAVFFDDDAVQQCTELIENLSEMHANILLFAVYHKHQPSTPDELSDALIPLLRSAFPGIKVAAGTNANFAQLNRNRPSSIHPDHICWSIHPQEHASDYLTLVENLKAQSCTTESARAFSEGKGIWISPVSFARRFNANLGFHSDVNKNGISAGADLRLRNMEGACWVAGSFKHLAESGVNGISLLETAGDAGILNSEALNDKSQAPEAIKIVKYPVYYFLRNLLKHKEYKIMPSESTDRLSVDAIVLIDKSDLKVILINYTEESIAVKICFGTSLETDFVICDKPEGEAGPGHSYILQAKIKVGPRFKLKPFSITFINGKS